MASESTYTPLRMAKELYMLQNNGKRKRGRKPVFNASQFYPWKVELEMKEFIASMMRENGKLLKELALLGYQADGIDDVNAADVVTPSNIEEKAGDFFREISDFSSRKMDDFAEKTVGRTIGYIPNQSKLRDDFVNNFVANCKSAAEDQKKEIAAAVYKHRMFPNEDSGSLVKEINAINTKYTKNKAKFIARNETGNLNGAIQRTQMEGAGFRYYKWMCMLDGVTRDTHRSMNGLVCDWEDDTVYSDDGGKTWKKRTGSMFIGQPGQDYNCRCTAIPFDPELEDDYEVKEMPEEKPEEKAPSPLEKAREELAKAEERAEKAENEVKELKVKVTNYDKMIRSESAESRQEQLEITKTLFKDVDEKLESKLVGASLKVLNREVSKNYAELGIVSLNKLQAHKGKGIAAYGEGILYINYDKFNDMVLNPKEFFEENVVELKKRKLMRFLAIEKVEDVRSYVFYHEFGHYLFEKYNKSNSNAYDELCGIYEKVKKNGFIRSVSAYALEDAYEFFSEIYAMSKNNYSELPDYLLDFIRKVTK